MTLQLEPTTKLQTGQARLNELYVAPQGEGVHMGIPMLFVRLQGCPLRCNWCDTPQTWDFSGGEILTQEALLTRILSYNVEWVTITGGEPLSPYHKNTLGFLLRELHTLRFTEIWTSGMQPIPEEFLPLASSWVVDIKPPDSGMEVYSKHALVNRYRSQDQVKVVISSYRDLDFAIEAEKKLKGYPTFLLSPAFAYEDFVPEIDPKEVSNFVRDHPRFRLSLQTHKFLFGDEKGR